MVLNPTSNLLKSALYFFFTVLSSLGLIRFVNQSFTHDLFLRFSLCHKYEYIYIFIFFSIRGLLFQTIWCLLFWNRRKIERLTQFPKKSLKWWKTGIYLKIGGAGSFFGNCVNRSIFLRFQKRRHQIVRKSNPLIARYKKMVFTTLGGGRSLPVIQENK